MLDVNVLTENLDEFRARLALRRAGDLPLDEIAALNLRRKELQRERDLMVQEQRELGPKIAQAKKAGQDAADLMARSTGIKDGIRTREQEQREVEDELRAKLLLVPNLPHPEAPPGGEEDGVVRRTWGEPPAFEFAPRDHLALAEGRFLELGERSTRLSGTSFAVFRGEGARLVRALMSFFLDLHTREHGYTEIWPPLLVNEATLTGTGQLPKFREELYSIPADGLFLIPTAEVPVTNLHQDEILPGEDLPLGYCAYTPCFRREAGAAGKMTRGLKRLHQFDKVELVRFCRPEESDAEHQRLLGHCEEPLRRLGLHYRIKELATGDTGFSAARCYDIEAWAPGAQEWLEVSSVSTFTDFQARRANIRYKDRPSDQNRKPKTAHVHTLNGSGLAFPRVIVCLLETYQQPDGTIRVPDALRPYLGAETLGQPLA